MSDQSPPLFSAQKRERQIKRVLPAFYNKKYDFLYRLAAQSVAERLQLMKAQFKNILLFGGLGLPDLILSLGTLYPDRSVTVADTTDAVFADLPADDSLTNHQLKKGWNALPFSPNSFDLVISFMHLHTINDVPGLMIQCRHILRADGAFLAVFPGGESLSELRESLMIGEMETRGGVAQRTAPMIGLENAGALLQRADLRLPVSDYERHTLTYPDLYRLLSDLRGMALGAMLTQSGGPLRRDTLKMAETIYRQRFALRNKRLPLTLDLLHLIGWAPAAGQPQPLKPGSAENSLADALNTDEHEG